MAIIAKYSLNGNIQNIIKYDFLGNTNDSIGSLNLSNNGCTLTTDKNGIANQAYNFNGTNNYMTAPTSTLYDITNGSIEFDLKLNSSTQVIATLFDHWDETTSSGYYAGFNIYYGTDGINQFKISVKISNQTLGNITYNTVVFGVSDTDFHKLKIEIKDGNKTYIYFDGVLIQSKLDHSNVNYSTNPVIYIGATKREFGGSIIDYFSGVIDSINFFSLNNNVIDSVGSNNGTATNVTGVDGKINGAGSFNGSSYIDCGNPTITNTFTLSALVYPISFVTEPKAIIGGGVTNGGIEWRIETTGQMGLIKQGIIGIDTNGGSVTLNKWNHIVTTYNGITGAYSFYINGVNTKNGTNLQTFSHTNTRIGVGFNGNMSWFNGLIDEVEIYNHTLTPAEIKNKYLFYNGFM